MFVAVCIVNTLSRIIAWHARFGPEKCRSLISSFMRLHVNFRSSRSSFELSFHWYNISTNSRVKVGFDDNLNLSALA